MRELSLHILDIAQNSVTAGAKNISILVDSDTKTDWITIEITDDGKGMSEELVKKVTDPFVTSRTTRKVGLGIPLFKHAAEAAGGDFEIRSVLGEGTTVTARLRLRHIDRQPMGKLEETMAILIGGSPGVDFSLQMRHDGRGFEIDTRSMRELLGGVPLNTPEVLTWTREYIREKMNDLYGGADI
ncbi:ATP-binding protein [Papillibacter cinnamivorans]|uniref:histidine kinase n=1 Tax=Papillibacter cinnamivorans DSM 12816 TaxID=1122930 RepID=A0A1W2A4F3_9FIRM|nr:ATP-binding protein [Papillibacter cinnamivorans]SMC55557.1 Histidine kinase-, DNA gyrase B-, and HSP90-like ATPase [Papillibacter cinnamivorans DSM 12816]